MNRRLVLLGALLGLLTTLMLAFAHRSVGYARDEGVYFEAGRHYGAWAAKLTHSPGKAMKKKQRDRYFRINNEHPALMKTAAGISARLLAHAPVAAADPDRDIDAPEGGVLQVMPEGAAMRLPAQILAGFGVFLLFVAGRRFSGSVAGGLMAAGWFILQPRVFFHAGLHAFDVPIAVATLAVVLAYRRALDSPRWGIGLGVALGVAIAIKHNALFLGPLLWLHYLSCLGHARYRQGRTVRWTQLVPLPFVSMAVIAPIVAVALWPWLWSDPIARIGEYFAFHRDHAYYNMEFLGQNYNRPPLPISYPLVMTFATVPAVFLLLSAIGLGTKLRDDLGTGSTEGGSASFTRPLPDPWPRLDGVLLAMLGLFPLALIALWWIPIFGGTKHWLTAYPFLALAAGVGWARLWARVKLPEKFKHAPALALALVLLPGAWVTIDGHPHGLSQYSALVGGPRGAARLGLNRGFWGHAAVPILEGGEETLPGGRVYIHDIHTTAQRQYLREGRWPEGWQPGRVEKARGAFIFHELHMAHDEIQVWDAMGTTQPAVVITLDDVPLTSFYAR